MIDGKELKQLLPDFEDQVQNSDGSKVSDEQIRELMITMRLINNTGVPQKMLLVQMYAESLIWVNGIDASLYPLLNPEKPNPMEVSLEPYQEIEVTLPYTLYDFQFQSKDWKNIENRTFDITLSFYPEKHIVTL